MIPANSSSSYRLTAADDPFVVVDNPVDKPFGVDESLWMAPLRLAIVSGKVEKVKALLQSGVSAIQWLYCEQGKPLISPMELAERNGHYKIFRLIYEQLLVEYEARLVDRYGAHEHSFLHSHREIFDIVRNFNWNSPMFIRLIRERIEDDPEYFKVIIQCIVEKVRCFTQNTLDQFIQIVRETVIDPNEPYYHTTFLVAGLYRQPEFMKAFAEIGYNFGTPEAIRVIRSNMIEWLNRRGLDDERCISEQTALLAFKVLGQYSNSLGVDQAIAESKYPAAKQAYLEGWLISAQKIKGLVGGYFLLNSSSIDDPTEIILSYMTPVLFQCQILHRPVVTVHLAETIQVRDIGIGHS